MEKKKFGFYFCQKDKILIDELKLGTFQQASNFCRKIWTPHLCENRQFDVNLYSMADELMFSILTKDESSELTEMAKSTFFGSGSYSHLEK